MRTAVLIHGFHLGSEVTINGQVYRWRDLAIGTIGNGTATGRATYGVMLAWQYEADLVIFSTGASRAPNGQYEAEVTYSAVRELMPDLARALAVPPIDLAAWLQPPRVLLDTASQNTGEELGRAIGACHDLHIDQLILVTSQFHAPRALSSALTVKHRTGSKMTILATSPNDVSRAPTIFEPPTRPDRPSEPWDQTLSGIFQIPENYRPRAHKEIEGVISYYANHDKPRH